MPKQIPALLRRKVTEIDFGDISTQFLHLCPKASKLFNKMVSAAEDDGSADREHGIKKKTEDYINNKPDHVRRQQFKQYLGM